MEMKFKFMNDKEYLREMFNRTNVKFKDLKVDSEGNETMLNVSRNDENIYFVFDRHGQLKDIFVDN